jgi:elongation factor Ts
MPEITAQDVKKLRDETGVGMMDAKGALTEAGGDMERAREILREKGLAKREKLSGRSATEGQVHAYIHPGAKIGVLVEISCETDFVARLEEFQELIHDVALHISFANPEYVSREEVPEEVVAKEKSFLEKQAAESGKPENVIPKIVEGQINAFYKSICLLDQPFIREDKKTIGELVHDLAVKVGENVQVRRFVRFEVGK